MRSTSAARSVEASRRPIVESSMARRDEKYSMTRRKDMIGESRQCNSPSLDRCGSKFVWIISAVFTGIEARVGRESPFVMK